MKDRPYQEKQKFSINLFLRSQSRAMLKVEFVQRCLNRISSTQVRLSVNGNVWRLHRFSKQKLTVRVSENVKEILTFFENQSHYAPNPRPTLKTIDELKIPKIAKSFHYFFHSELMDSKTVNQLIFK